MFLIFKIVFNRRGTSKGGFFPLDNIRRRNSYGGQGICEHRFGAAKIGE